RSPDPILPLSAPEETRRCRAQTQCNSVPHRRLLLRIGPCGRRGSYRQEPTSPTTPAHALLFPPAAFRESRCAGDALRSAPRRSARLPATFLPAHWRWFALCPTGLLRGGLRRSRRGST